ncbi:hypothetical protein GGS20DRAFT_540870 [Poronia punctata]|nr:hypothetical protein GGS20DRAFT_540870 [Poronia punctata]
MVASVLAMVLVSATRLLFQPIMRKPMPDLVKVSELARTFESLIVFSENSVSHVSSLQATGLAVEDLSESVRTTDIASAPQIIQALDTLAENLKLLALELTRFFANVDGDIDGILMVMDWAQRELHPLRDTENARLSMILSNVHGVLCAAGILENPNTGDPTNLGVLVNTMFGMSHAQLTHQTLQRTFNQFVAVLEEAIEEELQQSVKLFRLFEAIDKQFQNLARIVTHERSEQEEQHAETLSSLWTRLLGPKASEVRKYESNRDLLAHLSDKTYQNKQILITHNHKLITLKSGLERTRRNLISPLVRSVNSTTLTLEEQIKGLESVGGKLGETRARQRWRIMEMMFGSGSLPTPPPLPSTRTAKPLL